MIPHAALDRPCKSCTQLVVLKLISSIVLGDGEGVEKGSSGMIHPSWVGGAHSPKVLRERCHVP